MELCRGGGFLLSFIFLLFSISSLTGHFLQELPFVDVIFYFFLSIAPSVLTSAAELAVAGLAPSRPLLHR